MHQLWLILVWPFSCPKTFAFCNILCTQKKVVFVLWGLNFLQYWKLVHFGLFFVLFRRSNIFSLRFICINYDWSWPFFSQKLSAVLKCLCTQKKVIFVLRVLIFPPLSAGLMKACPLWALSVHFVPFLSFFGGQISRKHGKENYGNFSSGHFGPFLSTLGRFVHFGLFLSTLGHFCSFSLAKWVILNHGKRELCKATFLDVALSNSVFSFFNFSHELYWSTTKYKKSLQYSIHYLVVFATIQILYCFMKLIFLVFYFAKFL